MVKKLVVCECLEKQPKNLMRVCGRLGREWMDVKKRKNNKWDGRFLRTTVRRDSNKVSVTYRYEAIQLEGPIGEEEQERCQSKDCGTRAS